MVGRRSLLLWLGVLLVVCAGAPQGPFVGLLPDAVRERIGSSHSALVLWQGGLLAALCLTVLSVLHTRPHRTERIAALVERVGASRVAPLALLIAAVGFRLLLTTLGYTSMSSDEFTRSLYASDMARTGDLLSSRLWLPLPIAMQAVLWELGLELWWSGRALALGAGIGCLLAAALLAHELKPGSRVALTLTLLLLFAQPVLCWLSLVPLAGVFQGAFLTLSVALLVRAERLASPHALMASAVAYALACLCRFEAWALLPLWMIGAALWWWRRRETVPLRSLWAAALPVATISAWLLSHQVRYSDALYSVHGIAQLARSSGIASSSAAVRLGFMLGIASLPFLLLAVAGARSARGHRHALAPIVFGFGHLAALAGGLTFGMSPSHNIERLLLPAYLVLAPVGAVYVAELLQRRHRLAVVALAGLAVLLFLDVRFALNYPKGPPASAVNLGRALAKALSEESRVSTPPRPDRVLLEADPISAAHIPVQVGIDPVAQVDLYAEEIRNGFYRFRGFVPADGWDALVGRERFDVVILRTKRPPPAGYHLWQRTPEFSVHVRDDRTLGSQDVRDGP